MAGVVAVARVVAVVDLVAEAALDRRQRLRRLPRKGTRYRNHHGTRVRPHPPPLARNLASYGGTPRREIQAAGPVVAADSEAAAADRRAPNFKRACSSASGRCREELLLLLGRMKERGGDTSAFEAARQPAKKGAAKTAAAQQPSTIDALFAPLPVVETRGRAWLYLDNQLKPVTLRLGISDGTYTELISDELQESSEVVTGVTGLASTRGTPTQGGTGNPLMPGRGGPGGGPGRGGRG